MGFVDVYGETLAVKTEGWWDATHRRFEQVLLDLLPRGAAWNRDGERLRALVRAQATELSRVDLRALKLIRELDPATTFELVTDWEEMLGLPDCEQPGTLEGRRKAIAAKLLAQTGHDQGIGFWTELLAALGYELLYVNKGHKVTTCVDDCIDPLWTDEWEFVWELVVYSGDEDALLACVVEHQALIETLALIHYAWQAPTTVPLSSDTLRGIATNNKGFSVGVGDNSLVVRAGGDMLTWVAETPPLTGNYNCVCLGDTEGVRLIAAGPATKIIYSDDGGDTWSSAAAAAVTVEVFGVSRGPLVDAVVVAVGVGGRTFRSTNGGANWSSIASPVVKDLRAVTRATLAIVAVGVDRTAIRSSSNGASWSDVSPGGGTEDLFGVAAWETTVVAVGESGLILRSTDGGATWVQVTSPTTATLRAVTSSPTGRWTACGLGGVILQSSDGGVTWVERTSPTTEDLYAAGIDWPSGQAIVGGANLVIFLE